jgi:lipopolysaccharide export system permease protein
MSPFRRMDRLILAEIAGPFVGSALLFTGLFFAGGEIARIAEFLGRGVSWLTIGNLILLTLPGIIALTFPMAMLLATLLGFGACPTTRRWSPFSPPAPPSSG